MKRILISLAFFALISAVSIAGSEKQEPAHFNSGARRSPSRLLGPRGTASIPLWFCSTAWTVLAHPRPRCIAIWLPNMLAAVI